MTAFDSNVPARNQPKTRKVQIATVLQQAQIEQHKLLANKQVQQTTGAQKQQAQTEQQKKLANERAKQAAEAKKIQQTCANEKARLAEQLLLQERTRVGVLNPMTEKYNRGSLPMLVEKPTSEQARAWAETMQRLQTTQMQNDLAKIDSLLAFGDASEEDARRPANRIFSH